MKQFLLVFVTSARRPYELGGSLIRNYLLGFFEQLLFEALEEYARVVGEQYRHQYLILPMVADGGILDGKVDESLRVLIIGKKLIRQPVPKRSANREGASYLLIETLIILRTNKSLVDDLVQSPF